MLTTLRSYRPTEREAHRLQPIDMLDAGAVTAGAASFGPDLVIHCGILNDLGGLYRDRSAAW